MTLASARARLVPIVAGYAIGILVLTLAPQAQQAFFWFSRQRPDHQRTGLILAGLLAFGLVAAGAKLFGPPDPRKLSHGSAKWGRPSRFADQTGFLLGADGSRLLRQGGEAHLITIAPSGAGKGVGTVIPTLLDYPGSIFVVDVKGENYAVTSWYREERLKQRICVLDPFEVVCHPGHRHFAGYNPVDFINVAKPDAFDASNLIASTIVVPEQVATDQIWTDAARDITTALILHIAATRPPAERHLGTLAELLSLPDSLFRDLLHELAETKLCGRLVANAANRLREKDDRLFGSVIFTTTMRGVRGTIESPIIQRVLHKSSFCFREMRTRPTTVYLVLPPNYLDTYGRWLRLIVASALHELTAPAPVQTAHRTLFLLDEFATLKHLPIVTEKIAYARGYGISLWLVLQDLAQLKTHYPKDWETLLSQTAIKQAFGVNDVGTAEYLSKLLGQTTVNAMSSSASHGTSGSSGAGLFGGSSSSRSHSTGPAGRPLLFPDEIRRLPPDQLLLLLSGHDPYKVRRINYLEHPFFADRYRPNRFHV